MATIISNQQIWTNPSRSIQVNGEYRNRTATTVEVNLTSILTMNTSSGVSGYGSYFRPTINGVTQPRVTQKGTTPDSWYGSPISTSTGWIIIDVTNTTTSIPISVLFTTDDPDDTDATKTGTLLIPLFGYNSKMNIDGTWKDGVFYVNVEGTWKQASPYANVSGTWKQID